MRYDYLIIGGGIAGIMAAETIRGRDPQATIGILSAEPHLLYSRVLLPSFLKNRIPREKLFLRSHDDFAPQGIDLILNEKASYVDVKQKEVGTSNDRIFGYDKLLLASGGHPAAWDVNGGKPYLCRLHNLGDADRLFALLDVLRVPAVIGDSFIALEFLEIFALRRMSITLIMRGPHFFSRFLDRLGGEMLEDNFSRNGIAILAGDEIIEIAPKDNGYLALTRRGQRVECDIVAAGIGLERNLEFLRGSGIELGERGIKVNEYLETSVPGVFAAGDIAEFYDVIFGKHRIVGNWTNAVLQGERAGLNMYGERGLFRNVSSYSITNLGYQITVVGECDMQSEEIVRADGIRHQYERLCLQKGILVGAALINRFQDKAHIAGLIETRTPIEPHRDKLGNIEFDIRHIPVVR